MTRAAEVVVVGAGPGGLNAALYAARAGAKVLLLDGYARAGGQYYLQPPEGFERSARQKEGEQLAAWVRDAGVELLSGATVWNLSGDLVVTYALGGSSRQVKAGAVILASGAYERVLPFPGWTLPGVITPGAAQTLLYQGVRPGRRALVCGTGPLLLTTAMKLLHAGVEVAAVLEGADLARLGWNKVGGMWGQWKRAAEGLECLWAFARHGTVFRTGWGIVAVHGQEGVEGATIAQLDANWRPIVGTQHEVTCDTVCIGFGLIPFNSLGRMAGVEQEWCQELGGEVPRRGPDMQTSIPGLYAVGDGAGIGGYKMALIEGAEAGLLAAARLDRRHPDYEALLRGLEKKRRREAAFQQLYGLLFTPGPGVYELATDDTLVCRCEGVTLGNLHHAVRAGAIQDISELKNLTRCGMGECQGRVCGSMVTHTLANLAGLRPAQVGSYAPRPPLFPLPLEQFLIEE